MIQDIRSVGRKLSCNQSLCFNLKCYLCFSSLIGRFLGCVKICFMPPVWKVGLLVLTSEGGVSRPVVGAGPEAAFSCWDPRPMGLGGLTGVTRSGQDRTQGIWAQDCGSWAPFVPSFTLFLLPLRYSLKLGVTQTKTWLHNKTYMKTGDSMEPDDCTLCDHQYRHLLNGFAFLARYYYKSI